MKSKQNKTPNINLQPEPLIVVRNDGKRVAVCTCGKTQNGIACDGSHKNG